MRSVSAFFFAALLVTALGVDPIKYESPKLNTVETNPSVRLDPYIRKALLRALTELEETSNFTVDDATDNAFTESTETLTASTDSANTIPSKENIQIHSFVVNGQAAFENKTESSPTIIDNITIFSTTAGNVENHVTATLPTKAPFDEIFQTKETGVNIQQVRSIQTNAKIIKNNIINNNKLTSVKASTTTSIPTTTTTTTTTPKPTHNEDGENIESVNQRDVQVFQAPLVAAFTVHQDASGIPKKVVPIYQQSLNQNFPKSTVSTAEPSNLSPGTQKTTQPDFITQQLLLQKQLEEKQRFLEEQLHQLQNQQRQQEELLKKQQYLLLQKDSQIQSQQQQKEQFKRQQQLSDQQRLQATNTINNFQLQQLQKTQQLPPAAQTLNSFQTPSTQSSVSILPSLPLDQSSVLAVSQQQLPSREAVDFLLNLRNQQREQFPLQENHLPQGISNFLQPQANFHQGPNLNQIRPVDPAFRQKQGNRVFRHESGVGNLGLNNVNNNFNHFNNNFNRFNNQPNNFGQPNRFFSSQLNPDAELQQLLVQTGLDGRNPEDINIVSKVLSLNHGVAFNNNLSNRLPFDTPRPTRQNFSFNRASPFGKK